jgi:predicted phosphodiesterase
MSEELIAKQGAVSQALDAAFRRAEEQEQAEGEMKLDLQTAKFIIVSDHHKGNRNGADDFMICERAYNAALAYYYHQGYTLVILGDAEELWEERPQTVLSAYSHTLALEGKFHQDGRYLRFWGNHDDDWSYPNLIEKLLVPALGGRTVKVRETLIMHVMDGEEKIGRFFLAHGHQGTLDSDKIAPISKLIVRYFWRPIQRLIKFSFNSPAQDFQLRQAHDSAMYFWSEAQEKVVLIAGHTHRPVFKSETHEATIRKSLQKAEETLSKDPDNKDTQKQVAGLAAELEWILAQNRQAPGESAVIELKKPSYFNTGCCAFLDGDVTGLEISNGKIRLVRWPDDEDEPKPKELVSVDLKKVFADC